MCEILPSIPVILDTYHTSELPGKLKTKPDAWVPPPNIDLTNLGLGWALTVFIKRTLDDSNVQPWLKTDAVTQVCKECEVITK